jgi:hypothetical protein
MSAVSAVTVPGVVLNSANAMSELVQGQHQPGVYTMSKDQSAEILSTQRKPRQHPGEIRLISVI